MLIKNRKSTFLAALALAIGTAQVPAQAMPLSVQVYGTCSGTWVTDDWGNQTCYTGGFSGGSGSVDGTTFGGSSGGSTLMGVTIPVPGYWDAKMNLSATKITAPGLSLSDEPLVRQGVVKAAQGVYPHSVKPPGSLCRVYYGSGETEQWIKGESGLSSLAWTPVVGSQTYP